MRATDKRIQPDNWPKPSTPLPSSAATSPGRRTTAFPAKVSPSAAEEIRRLGRQAKRLAKKEGRKTLYPGFTKNLAEHHGVTMRCIQLIMKGERQTGKKAGRPTSR